MGMMRTLPCSWDFFFLFSFSSSLYHTYHCSTNLAKLHLIPAGSLPEKRHWLDNRFLAESIEAVSKRIDQRQLQEILRVSAAIRNFKPEDFPQSIVHGDINPANCLFLGGELRAFIDWEEVGIGASVLDFARSVLGFCFVDQPDSSVAFDVHLYKSLYDGYTRIRAFTPEGRARLSWP